MISYRLLSVVLSDWNMFHQPVLATIQQLFRYLKKKHLKKEYIAFWNFKNEHLYNWNSSVLIKSKY